MSASEQHKKIIAKFCLSRDISKRVPPPFLRRNIETVLDAHERLLGRSANHASREQMRHNGRRDAVFEWPAQSALDKLVQRPAMRIDALQIRKLKGSGSVEWQKPQREVENNELDWLPDPEAELVLPCRFKVDIIEKTLSGGRKPTTSLEASATITQHQTDRGQRFFDIALHEPLSIPVERLFTDMQGNGDGDRRWEQRMAEKYTMEMSFQLKDSEAGGKFLSVLESRVSTDLTKIASHEMKVKATWSDLPHCPQHHLLQLMRPSGHKLIPLQYGLEMQIGWPQRRATPLELHNQAFNLANGQLPPRMSSQTPSSVDCIVRYCYSVQQGADIETRVKTRDKLTCIFCEHSPEFRDAERLLGHYNLYHRQFHWTLDSQDAEEDGRDIITISMRTSDDVSGDDESDQDGATEFGMLQPEEPFDLKAYNSGDRTWAKSGRLRAPREVSSASAPSIVRQRGRPRKMQDSATASASPAPMAVAPTSQKRPALDEVPDLPDLKRKKYVVPDIPGVTFYHSLSKKPMAPGEELSESDDELYDNRLAEPQRLSMLELGLSADEQEFYAAFNRHMDIERSGSKIFMREGVVRFTRKHLRKLRHPVWQRMFMKKLEHLVTHRVVGPDVMDFCIGLMIGDAGVGAKKLGEELNGGRDGNDSAVEVNGDFHADGTGSEMLESSTPQKKKSQRWVGTGADRYTISNRFGDGFGAAQSKNSGQRPSSRDSAAANHVSKSDDNSRKRVVYNNSTGGFVERTGPDSYVALNRRTRSPTGSTASADISAARTSVSADGIRPIAMESVVCWRLGETYAEKNYRVQDFVKDRSGRAFKDPEPRDISLKKFYAALTENLDYDRRLDIITCRPSMRESGPLETISDWVRYLTLCRDCNYDLRFEIRRIRNESDLASSMDGEAQVITYNAVQGNRRAAEAPKHKLESNQEASMKCICVCGERANKGRGSVACENIGCKRQWFHLRCVGLERPSMEWRCGDCPTVNGT